jgi:serine/threonine protein phosphatase PrpC
MVSEPDILQALTGRTPEESTWELIDMANAAGGSDNISVIVIEALE